MPTKNYLITSEPKTGWRAYKQRSKNIPKEHVNVQ